jgi:tetratricopeptide (TPR) repeat protein
VGGGATINERNVNAGQVEAAIRGGQLDRARRLAEDAVDGDDFFLLTLARIAFVEGRRGEAIRLLARLAGRVRDPATWARMASLEEAMGRHPAARRWALRAVDADPAPRAFRLLVELCRAAGRDEEADQWRERLLERFPDDPWGLEERAAARFAEGRHDEALALYERIPGPYAAWARAEILLRRGDDAAALEACRAGLSPDAARPWAALRAAQILSRADRIEEALAVLGDAPTEELAELRARLLERAGRPEEAAALRRAAMGGNAAAVEARLRAPRMVLHGCRDRHGWRRLHIRPIVYLREGGSEWTGWARARVDAIVAFHLRQFGPHPGLTVAPLVERRGIRPFSFFRHAVEHQGFRALTRDLPLEHRRKHEIMIVLHCGDEPPLTEGFGGYGWAMIHCAARDGYAEAIIAHEFYHASLGLQHTDGEKDILDAGGLMGYPGALSRLPDAWLHPLQRARCLTPPRALREVRRGHRHEERDAWDEAARCYREAVRLDPLYVWPAARLAQVEIHRGDYGAALAVLEELRASDDTPEHAVQHAHVLMDLGRVGEAERLLSAMRGADSERGHLLAAFAWASAWYHRKALRHARAALLHNPRSLGGKVSAACALASLGRFAEARRLWHAVLEADPNWAESIDRLAVMEAEEGRLALAWRLIRRAGGVKKAGPVHHQARARVYAYAGAWEEAERSLRRALEDAPNTLSARLFLAWVLLVLERREEAREAFARCHRSGRLSPEGRVAAAWMGILDRHDSAAAGRTLGRLFRRDPRNGCIAHALVLLGDLPRAALLRLEPGLR